VELVEEFAALAVMGNLPFYPVTLGLTPGLHPNIGPTVPCVPVISLALQILAEKGKMKQFF